MAERWQQWMPFHIDRWRGSPSVQAMHPAAQMGYLNLLCSCWQSADCCVPSDPVDLATESRLGDDLWALYGPRILRKFVDVAGRWRNSVLFVEWEEAKSKFEANQKARSEAGKIGNAIRWGRKCDEDATKTIAKPSQNIATLTLTGTGTGTDTKEKQKPSRAKKPREEKVTDSRHVPFRLACEVYAKHKAVTFVWDASEAKSLSDLLKAAPTLTLAEFQTCIQNRARSPGTPHGDRPRLYLPNILRYQQSPLSQFNRTEEVNGTNRKLDKDDTNERNARAALDALTNGSGRTDVLGIGSASGGDGEDLYGLRGRPELLAPGGFGDGDTVVVIEGETGRRDGFPSFGDDSG